MRWSAFFLSIYVSLFLTILIIISFNVSFIGKRYISPLPVENDIPLSRIIRDNYKTESTKNLCEDTRFIYSYVLNVTQEGTVYALALALNRII